MIFLCFDVPGVIIERITERIIRGVAERETRLGNLKKLIIEIQSNLEDSNRELLEESGRDVRRYLTSRHIREQAYKFENLLEAFNINNSYFIKCTPLIPTAKIWPIVDGFTRVDEALKDINTRPMEFEFGTPFGYNNYAEGNAANAAVEPYKFVGRVEETKRLLSYLCLDEEAGFQVVSISGMCGIGKTALARQLLDHPRIASHFEYRDWIDAKQEFDVELKRLRMRLSSVENRAEPPRTLIMLDGICSVKDLDSLREILVLPRTNSKSTRKILITTRMKQVAENAHKTIHLRRLTDNEGCELLVKNVPDFWGDKMHQGLRKNIVNFCCGLPLAFVCFLESMKRKRMEELKEMVTKLLNVGSSERYETQEVQKALKVLATTYYDLPYILQQIFLYMGVLQEDTLVEVEKLCLLSLADGMLKPLQRGAERLVDIEKSCVNEVGHIIDLVEGEEPGITRFKYCQLNGLMRDLSMLINKDEHFLKVVDFARGNQAAPDSSSSSLGFKTFFRVAINLDDYEEGSGFPLEDDEMMHMRVLLLSAKKKKFSGGEFPSLVKFKYMRVLDFDGFDFEETNLPKGIKRAVHLRYLSFKDCVLHKLPSWVTNLKLLCILDLRVQHSTTMVIPNVLGKMKRLKHLYFPLSFETEGGCKLSLDGLTELETITNFNASMLNLDDIHGLQKLQYLDANTITNVEEIECILQFMMKNSDGDSPRASLEIRNFDCYAEERDYVFRKLVACPSLIALSMKGSIRTLVADEISENLTKIVFTGSELVLDPMETLEKLPKLRVLVLNDVFVGNKIECSPSGFCELKVLKILNLHFLEKWVLGDGAMPKLSTLAIYNCGRLEMLPEGLRSVHGLRELIVSRMPIDFGKRIRVGEDRFKIQHVPAITFEDMY